MVQPSTGVAHDAVHIERLRHLPKPTRRNAWVRYLVPNGCQGGGFMLFIVGLAAQSVGLAVLGAMVWLIGGILEVIWLYTMVDELNSLVGSTDSGLTSRNMFSPFFAVIPAMSRWLRWEKIPDMVAVAKRRVGTPNRRKHRLAYFFACKWAFSEDLNEILDVLEGRVPPHSGAPDTHRPPGNMGQHNWY
jgi:hypothetical protein